MDIVSALGGIGAAFGLSTSAGLNAYIPLLIVAVVANTRWLNLEAPYDTLASPWVIGILVVLLVIEMLVDKVPAVDTINDMIQTFIRPAAGAVLFAANANIITDIHPIIAIVAGILLAGTVHATKGVVRPAVTVSTAGMGNWVVSIVEDIVAFFVSLLALILPVITLLVGIAILFYVVRWVYRRRTVSNKLVF